MEFVKTEFGKKNTQPIFTVVLFITSWYYTKQFIEQLHPNITLNVVNVLQHTNTASEGKTIPLQAWTGPEGSRRLRLPDFKTVGT